MNRIAKRIVFLFFATYFVLGLNLVLDYGMSWDEAKQRRNGLISLDHIIKTTGLDWELTYPDVNLETSGGRQYTVLYPIVTTFLERVFGLTEDFRGRYLMRHIIVFLLFWLASIYFFRLMNDRLKNYKLALVSSLFFILYPRIFAHSFYNPKDIILLSFYAIATFYLVRYFKQPSFKRAASFAFASALVLNSRIVGVMIPAFAIGFAVLLLFSRWWELDFRKPLIKTFPVYLLLTAALAVLFFPYAWGNPLERSVEAFDLMANFPWGSELLYFGEFIKGEEVPWEYLFVWIGITTPILYLVLLLLGIVLLIWSLRKEIGRFRFGQTPNSLTDWTLLGLLFGPIIAVFYFQSTIYNGWRQLFFIYPCMAGIMGIAMHYLLKSRYKKILSFIILVNLLGIAYWMIKNHPHQQAYFNVFAGKNITMQFDIDYWGVAYKQAMEELYQRDSSAIIQMKCANYSCEDNYRFLPKKYKERLKLRYGPQFGEYYITNFRRPKEFERFRAGLYPYAYPYFFIEVDGEKLIGVYKMN